MPRSRAGESPQFEGMLRILKRQICIHPPSKLPRKPRPSKLFEQKTSLCLVAFAMGQNLLSIALFPIGPKIGLFPYDPPKKMCLTFNIFQTKLAYSELFKRD